MESPYKSPAPIPPDPAPFVEKNDSFLSWWGIIPALAVLVFEVLYGWPKAKAQGNDVAGTVGYFAGEVAGGILIPAIIAWIVYRITGRSRRSSTVTFTIVCALVCLSLPGGAIRAMKLSTEPTPISLEDFRIQIPPGWQRGNPNREKTQVLLAHAAGSGIVGMIQVDVGTPALPTADEMAKSLAGPDGRVLPEPVNVDGIAAIRVETSSSDLSRPKVVLIVYHNAKVYLIMGAATTGNVVSSAFDEVVRSWRWTQKE
jgi:hypothetical protein